MIKYFAKVCEVSDWNTLRQGDIVQFTYLSSESRKILKVRALLMSKDSSYKFLFVLASTRISINVFPESQRVKDMILLQRRYSPRKMNFLFDKTNIQI